MSQLRGSVRVLTVLELYITRSAFRIVSILSLPYNSTVFRNRNSHSPGGTARRTDGLHPDSASSNAPYR